LVEGDNRMVFGKISRRSSKEDLIFDIFNFLILGIITLIVLYPLYFMIIASISDPNYVANGKVILLPKNITFEGYQKILNYKAIWTGYRNTIIYSSVGALISVVLTITFAYPLSRKDFFGKRFFMIVVLITMFFNGGMIPTYLVVRKLGMINTIWAMVLPNAVTAFNIIIARTFFNMTIPEELREAASIDGCTDFMFFAKIVVPLSKPIIAVLALFAIVGQWNGFFDALLYLTKENLYPLQLVLRNILIQSQSVNQLTESAATIIAQQRQAELMKYGVIIVSSVPLLIFYPFIQKYFAKGMMVGSVKG
jgi:putative aldouronate transport system permease protein